MCVMDKSPANSRIKAGSDVKILVKIYAVPPPLLIPLLENKKLKFENKCQTMSLLKATISFTV